MSLKKDRMPVWQIILIILSCILGLWAIVNCFVNDNIPEVFGMGIILIISIIGFSYLLDAIEKRRLRYDKQQWSEEWYSKAWTVFDCALTFLFLGFSSLVYTLNNAKTNPNATVYVSGSRTTLDGVFYNLWPFSQVIAVNTRLSATTSGGWALTADSLKVFYRVSGVAIMDTANLKESVIKVANSKRSRHDLIQAYTAFITAEANQAISRLMARQLFGPIVVLDSAQSRFTTTVSNATLRFDPTASSLDYNEFHKLGYRRQHIDLIDIHRQ